MNQLTTIANKLPAPDYRLEKDTRDLVCWILSDPTAPVGLTRSLTTEERRRIELRILELTEALSARDSEITRRNIAAMMLSIPSGRAAGEEARAIVSAYVNALSDLPPWAVSEAAQNFIRGKVAASNPAFAPSAAEVHKEATNVAGRYFAEIDRWKRILLGEVVPRVPLREPTPAERKAITAARQKTAAEIALENRAAAMGLDPEQALRNTPDAPSALGHLQKLNASPSR